MLDPTAFPTSIDLTDSGFDLTAHQIESLGEFVQDQNLTVDVAAPGSESQAITVRPSTPTDLIFKLTFDDPAGTYAPYYSAIQSNIVAAGLNWNQHIHGKGSLEIDVKFSLTGGAVATGRSITTWFIRNNGEFGVYETAAIAELLTGIDPTGDNPDIEFNIDPDDLTNTLWFDPDPLTRTTPVPTNKTDALSVFLHEFGHAIAFNGWKSDIDGTLPGNYQSTYDEQVSFDGTNFFFTGSRAMAVYGAPVPLNFGNITHLGNNAPRPGSDLSEDLMNPYVADYGTRVGISALDLTILADTGIPIDPVRNDFNNDGKSDILWRNNDGSIAIWQMNAANVVSSSLASISTLPVSWKNVGTGDFNGDSKSDILWRNDNGRIVIWNMDGAKVVDSKLTSIPSLDNSWKNAGTGDFNGDGKSDILWRNDDGQIAIWSVLAGNNVVSSLTSTPSLDNSWKNAGTGDFNGDGKSDILWRNDDGTVVLWQMDGKNVVDSSRTSTPALDNSWKNAGIGDFNGDGKADILWRNDSGGVAIWRMDGANVVSADLTSISTLDRSWKVFGVSDFNGDSKADILWRNDSGSTAIWQMNGASIISSNLTSVQPLAGWQVAAPMI